MSAIATRAGINKERLYNYFGDKASLFSAVLSDELAALAQSVGRPSGGMEEVGEFAGRTFDYYQSHQYLARLLLWEGLSGVPAVDEAERAEHYRTKVAQYRAAVDDGRLPPDVQADHLVLQIIALAAWWFCVPQLARMITGVDPDSAEERARRRASVVAAASRLVAL